ncbi:MAG TPA: DNA alkylation repair protein, partial [Pasteurellaceae bacterium]|nr:DNA alkylation repair protein [Pasteurellaceae bacterium]
MNFNKLFIELNKLANSEKAEQMSAYMKNQFVYLGVQTPQRRAVCKSFFKVTARETVDWAFIEQCWASPYRELQYAAIDYLNMIKTQLTARDIPSLHGLIIRKSWWDTIDGLDRIVGSIALNYPEVNETLLAWSRDDNFWLRRVAIDHQLLRKEKTDTALLEKILLNNLGQREFFINKAIGWILRDYSKTDPAWVCDFIERHRES